MFTGIIEGIGRVEKVTSRRGGCRLVICPSSSTGLAGPFGRLRLGDSLSVNGRCLTVSQQSKYVRVTDGCTQKRGPDQGRPLPRDLACRQPGPTEAGRSCQPRAPDEVIGSPWGTPRSGARRRRRADSRNQEQWRRDRDADRFSGIHSPFSNPQRPRR